MADYQLEEVITRAQKRAFRTLPRRIYKDNPSWVHPLDSDIEAPFDPRRNELFDGGEAIRWIVRDGRGEVVGRLAAFYNRETAVKDNDQPTGGVGFFESVDDQQVAGLMFDAAREWLAARGMEAMDGPINFGDRDSWWGLLIEGFEFQPLYLNPYNPPYYRTLFENYGFQNYFNQYTYDRRFETGGFSPSVYERVKRLEETPGYRFEHIRMRDLKQVAENFRTIYNKAWAKFSGVKPMDSEHAQKLLGTLKPIIDPRLIYFAYFDDQPIGFFIQVPDLNRVIGRFRGRFHLVNKLRLWLMLHLTSRADRIFAVIFAVTPEFQGKGIETGMMNAYEKMVRSGKLKYKSLELAWIGDFNPVMMRMCEQYVCASRHKVHATYRYLFDREKEFHRCPRMGVKRSE
ncbi:hypothetical protein FACS1894159_04820 [Bacteroidia bacterium]|nr:hypothetical protein FACS1894159_04820 [Bacteroidia bacterium]